MTIRTSYGALRQFVREPLRWTAIADQPRNIVGLPLAMVELQHERIAFGAVDASAQRKPIPNQFGVSQVCSLAGIRGAAPSRYVSCRKFVVDCPCERCGPLVAIRAEHLALCDLLVDAFGRSHTSREIADVGDFCCWIAVIELENDGVCLAARDARMLEQKAKHMPLSEFAQARRISPISLNIYPTPPAIMLSRCFTAADATVRMSFASGHVCKRKLRLVADNAAPSAQALLPTRNTHVSILEFLF
ncbi:MAG: hypothetical protein LC797_08715 [Chloroflexi bacterium]|nr:hypothetical protein [Chloroflexota bacterium]